MQRRFLVTKVLGCVLLLASVVTASSWLKRGTPREHPVVSDGLSAAQITANLASGSNNNIDESETLTNAFTTTAGSPTVTVHYPSHGLAATNVVSFYNSTVVGGLNMDGGWIVAEAPNGNTITITHTAKANATVSATGTTVATQLAGDPDGKLRFLCKFSHLSYDDPILFPGQLGATHLHLFFGNTLTDYNSTYASLRATGDGTCGGGPLNRTAYWMPAMIDSAQNKVRIPFSFQWYYTNFRRDLLTYNSPRCDQVNPLNRTLADGRIAACPQYAMKRIERGVRAIFGYKAGADAYPTTYVGNMLATAWECQDTSGNQVGSGYRYLHHRTDSALGVTSNASCPANGKVAVRVISPTCWDGTHGSTITGRDGFDHFAHASEDGHSNVHCPATHPYKFLEFTVIADWNYTGGIAQVANWYLSSDRYGGADHEAGKTFHWDMWWAWNDTIQDHWSKNIHGMFPNPASSTAEGGPYINSWIGVVGPRSGPTGAVDWVGGPFLRNTNDGGLSGNATIGDCTYLGIAGKCKLAAPSGPIFDQLLDIPADPTP